MNGLNRGKILMLAAALSCGVVLSACSLPRITILTDPLSAEEHLNLGVAYEKKGEPDNALAEYAKAAGKLPRANVYMGNVYFARKEYNRAIEAYREAIGRDPSLADARNNLAWLFFTIGENLEEAEALALKAVELAPDNGEYRDTLQKIRERRAAG